MMRGLGVEFLLTVALNSLLSKLAESNNESGSIDISALSEYIQGVSPDSAWSKKFSML